MAYSTDGKKPLRQTERSNKLDRTLQELESAFSDWDSLNSVTSAKPSGGTKSATKKAATAPLSRQDEELRKKTKKLLTQLRRQISDLT